jgi:hypothetical protein
MVRCHGATWNKFTERGSFLGAVWRRRRSRSAPPPQSALRGPIHGPTYTSSCAETPLMLPCTPPIWPWPCMPSMGPCTPTSGPRSLACTTGTCPTFGPPPSGKGGGGGPPCGCATPRRYLPALHTIKSLRRAAWLLPMHRVAGEKEARALHTGQGLTPRRRGGRSCGGARGPRPACPSGSGARRGRARERASATSGGGRGAPRWS